jgi:hypothetical protein
VEESIICPGFPTSREFINVQASQVTSHQPSICPPPSSVHTPGMKIYQSGFPEIIKIKQGNSLLYLSLYRHCTYKCKSNIFSPLIYLKNHYSVEGFLPFMIIHPELMIFLVMDGDYTIWTISVLQMTNTEELRIKTNKA